MHLKQYLKQILNEKISDLEESISLTRESLKKLEGLNIQNSDYVVNLWFHLDKEGEKSTETNYKGGLSEAINQAETEFLEANNLNDISAIYSVKIMIGNTECLIPEDFYRDFKRKR